METDLGIYASRQFQVSEANTLLFDLTTGPRSQPFEGAFRDVTLKPFITGRYVSVHDQPTYWSWGAGMEATAQLRDWLKLSTVVLGRRRDFIDNADAPTNSRSSGNDAAVAMQLQAEVAPDVLRDARHQRHALHRFRLLRELSRARLRRLADHPLHRPGRAERPQMVPDRQRRRRLRGLRRGRSDDRSAVTRSQADLNLGLLLSVPIDDRFSLVGQTTYFQRSSSIGNYAFQAFNGLLGVSWRF